MSGRGGGDELTSLIRTNDNTSRNDYQKEYRSYLRTVLVIFFLLVVASAVAIVVLWINKPPLPVPCTGSSTASGFVSIPANSPIPIDPITFLSQGQTYKFAFQALGSPTLQVTYRLCNRIGFGANTTATCRNYTVSDSFFEGTFEDVFAGPINCSVDSFLSIEILQFQPKPAILMYCAASSVDDYLAYCYNGGGTYNEGGIAEETEQTFGWWGAYITNDTRPFTASYGIFGFNSTVQLGFCGQTFRQRQVPLIKYSTCWSTGFMNETCTPGISGEQKDSDFFNGVWTFNSSNFNFNSADLMHFEIDINRTGIGMYVAAIGERPFIDSICKLK